jgi:hypothetical protein
MFLGLARIQSYAALVKRYTRPTIPGIMERRSVINEWFLGDQDYVACNF